MNRYRVTLMDEDDNEFDVVVPAASRKAARTKADRIYEDDEVTKVVLDDGNEEPAKRTSKAKDSEDDGDGGEVEILSVEEVEDGEEGEEGKETTENGDTDTTDEEEEDTEPQHEHWFYKNRRKDAA